MFFFINGALNKQNSGIEHAQIDRSRVFDQYNMPYRLLYVNWNPQMSRWLPRFKLKPEKCVTMFDYYQGLSLIHI